MPAASACATRRRALPSAAAPSGIGSLPSKYSFWKSITSSAVLAAAIAVGALAPARVRIVGCVIVVLVVCFVMGRRARLPGGIAARATSLHAVSNDCRHPESVPMDNIR
ncbi:hypothetical protein D9M68_481920 [compost metagenome]